MMKVETKQEVGRLEKSVEQLRSLMNGKDKSYLLQIEIHRIINIYQLLRLLVKKKQ